MQYTIQELLAPGETVLGTAKGAVMTITLTDRKLIQTGFDFCSILPLTQISGVNMAKDTVEIVASVPRLTMSIPLRPADGNYDATRALCRELIRRIR